MVLRLANQTSGHLPILFNLPNLPPAHRLHRLEDGRVNSRRHFVQIIRIMPAAVEYHLMDDVKMW